MTTDRYGNLATDGGEVFLQLRQNADGVAIAMASQAPPLLFNEKYSLTAGYGYFDTSNAFGFAGSFRMTPNIYVSVGGGIGMDTSIGGGRASITIVRRR